MSKTSGQEDGVADRLHDLRELTRTKRFDKYWAKPLGEAMVNVGLAGGYTDEEWAELPWYGPMEQFLGNPQVTDIVVNGPGKEVFVVEDTVRQAAGMALHHDWIAFVQKQCLLRSGLVTPQNPQLWPGAGRQAAHMVIGTAEKHIRFALTRPPATPDGPTIAIRVLPRRWRTLDDLVLEGVLPREAGELLVEALRHGVTVLVAGMAGSGKTTLTAALLQSIGAEKRVIVIEESTELPELLDSVHVEVVRSGFSFSECVRFALRQRPDLITVGEVRGPEALAMLQAAATGHPGVATIHAPDCQSALRNLERMAGSQPDVRPETVRGMLASTTVPLVVVHVGRYGGRRRVGMIEEVRPSGMGGSIGDRFTTNQLFQYDYQAGQLVRTGWVDGAWGKGRL